MAPPQPLSPLPALKILMLHGYTQSGPLFDLKSRALQKALIRALPTYSLSFSHPTAPHRVQAPDQQAPPTVIAATPGANDVDDGDRAAAETYGWCRRVNDNPIVYEGMPAAFERVADTVRVQGPFDGVIGFSQGAALAAMVASALEIESTARRVPDLFPRLDVPVLAGGKQGPLKFAIFYSGFRAADERCAPFFDPPIITPTLHVLGQVDTVVEEPRARQLLAVCRDGAVVIHPGGHFLPSQRPWLDAAAGFVKKSVESKENGGKNIGGKEEIDVRDMEVPF